jgi:metallo-beta-lactamase family protein
MQEMVMTRNCPLECADVRLARTPDESRAINAVPGPVLIISASGMVSGGRVLHHLKQRLPDSRTTVLLVGYQALGTRGRQLQDGAESIKSYGDDIPVRAHVETVHGLSAHADAAGLIRWLRTARRPPRRAFVVHGDPARTGACDADRQGTGMGGERRCLSQSRSDRVNLITESLVRAGATR